MELLLEKSHGKLVDHELAFALALSGSLLVGEFTLLDVDVVFLGEVAQGLGIGKLLVLHDEIDRAAPLAAREALANALGSGHIERGSPVVMERTEPHIVSATVFQCHEVAHDINNVGRINDFVYSSSINHEIYPFVKTKVRLFPHPHNTPTQETATRTQVAAR